MKIDSLMHLKHLTYKVHSKSKIHQSFNYYITKNRDNYTLY